MNKTLDKKAFKIHFESSLDHLTKLTFDEVVEYVEMIDGYNDFNQDKVKNMLEQIDKLIPRKYYNENNPNNGKRDYSISIGRESSPVMYYNFVNYDFDGTEPDKIKNLFSPEKIKDIENVANRIGLADEFNTEYKKDGNIEQFKIRLWWD